MFLDFSYSKEENIKSDDPKLLQYSHILIEQRGKYLYENEHLQQTHDTLDTINCFSSIGVEYRSIFPVKIKTRPCIVILRRKANIKPPKIENSSPEMHFDNSNIDHNEKLIEINTTTSNDYENKQDDKSESLSDLDFEDDEQNTHNNEEQSNFVETDLKAPTRETKIKLRKLIERRYRQRKSNENTELVAINKRSTKSNIKHIIKFEKIKELIEKISQMDLKSICDLENETTKHCLLKIIDSYDLD